MTPKMTAMKDSVLNQSKTCTEQSSRPKYSTYIHIQSSSHTHKDSMVKSEGKHVSNENKSLIKLYQIW